MSCELKVYKLFSLVENLKGGEIIWAKYGCFPFWPAMVSSGRVGNRSGSLSGVYMVVHLYN